MRVITREDLIKDIVKFAEGLTTDALLDEFGKAYNAVYFTESELPNFEANVRLTALKREIIKRLRSNIYEYNNA